MDDLKAIKRNAIKKWKCVREFANQGQLHTANTLIGAPCAFCETARHCTNCHLYKKFGQRCCWLPEWITHEDAVCDAFDHGDSAAAKTALINMAEWAIKTIKEV